MATRGNERHLRYILLLGEGGLLILRAILERETENSGKSLDVLLQPKQRILSRKMDKKQLKKLYPQTSNVDKKTWDISLLGTVILQLFETSLSGDACNNIRKLKELRNDLAHQASFSMDEDVFDDARKTLAALLINLSSGLDRDVHDKCQNYVKQFHTDPIDVSTATERLKEISKFDEKMEEQLRFLTGLVIEVLVKCDRNHDVMQDLKQLIQQMDKFHSFQVVEAQMDLRGPNDNLTNMGETTIIGIFESALNRTEEEFLKLKRVVDKLLDAIENNGGKVFHKEKGCIVMKIRCTSCRGLLNLLKYLESEEFKQRLLDIAIMLEEIFKGVYHITFEVTQDSLRNILDSLRKQSSQTRPKERDIEEMRVGSDATENVTEGPIYIDVEKKALVNDIIELLDSPDYQDPEVILLIGSSGAGKSSLVNTIYKALTGKAHMIAKQGSGISTTVTTTLNGYANCGVTEHTIKNERLKTVSSKLPLIFDCAGLADENSENFRELLELLLGGYIQQKTSIPALVALQKSAGKGALKIIFNEQNPAFKVTRIVFVQGCTDQIPKNLIECLKEVLAIADKRTCVPKNLCDVFVLITKYDLVKDAEDSNLYGQHGDKFITLENLEKVEETLEEEFKYAGYRNKSRMHCICYNDEMGSNNPNIDKIALKFLKRMVEPGEPRVVDPTLVLHKRAKYRLFLNRVVNTMSGINLPKMLIAVAILIAVLAFLYTLLARGLTAAKNDTVGNTRASAQVNTSG